MLNRKVRGLAVTAVTIGSATLLTALGATGAHVAVTAAGNPGHAAEPAGAAMLANRVSVPVQASASSLPLGFLVNHNSIPARRYLCLGVSGGNINADAVQWLCTYGTANQQWYEGARNSAGYYQIYWIRDGVRQCLGVAGGSTAANAQVVGWNCLGTSHPDQYWAFLIDPSCPGFSSPVLNYKSQKLLSIAAGSYVNGAHAVIYGAHGSCNNQNWNIHS